MGTTKFTETQIRSALKAYEAGKSVADICRDMDVSKRTFYNWNKKYGEAESECFKQMKDLKEKYNSLQKMYSELATDHRMLKDVIKKQL